MLILSLVLILTGCFYSTPNEQETTENPPKPQAEISDARAQELRETFCAPTDDDGPQKNDLYDCGIYVKLLRYATNGQELGSYYFGIEGGVEAICPASNIQPVPEGCEELDRLQCKLIKENCDVIA